jgi:hypothetical protein
MSSRSRKFSISRTSVYGRKSVQLKPIPRNTQKFAMENWKVLSAAVLSGLIQRLQDPEEVEETSVTRTKLGFNFLGFNLLGGLNVVRDVHF